MKVRKFIVALNDKSTGDRGLMGVVMVGDPAFSTFGRTASRIAALSPVDRLGYVVPENEKAMRHLFPDVVGTRAERFKIVERRSLEEVKAEYICAICQDGGCEVKGVGCGE